MATTSDYVSQDLSANPSTNQLNAADYDPSGRIWRYSNTLYSWDVLDQLTKVDGTAAGREAWIHVYDTAGERVWSWWTSSSTPLDTFALRDPGGKVLSLFIKAQVSGAPSYSWDGSRLWVFARKVGEIPPKVSIGRTPG